MGNPARRHIFLVAGFITEVRHAANREAHARGCVLTVSGVDPRLAVNADRDLLLLAIGNLMQNAFKFTHLHTEVTLNPYAIADRILIDVKDNCGGLSPGDTQKMFLPFSQTSENRSGLGVGLSIARQSVESNDGILSVRAVPGTGCVFTINLPRNLMTDGGERSVARVLGRGNE